MEKYGLAKSHIFTNQIQGDTIIMHEEMKDFIKLSLNTPYLIGKDITAHGTMLYIPRHELDASSARLIGEHNYRKLRLPTLSQTN